MASQMPSEGAQTSTSSDSPSLSSIWHSALRKCPRAGTLRPSDGCTRGRAAPSARGPPPPRRYPLRRDRRHIATSCGRASGSHSELDRDPTVGLTRSIPRSARPGRAAAGTTRSGRPPPPPAGDPATQQPARGRRPRRRAAARATAFSHVATGVLRRPTYTTSSRPLRMFVVILSTWINVSDFDPSAVPYVVVYQYSNVHDFPIHYTTFQNTNTRARARVEHGDSMHSILRVPGTLCVPG